MMTTPTDRLLADLFRLQAEWCQRLGSFLYADLLRACAADIEAGGPVRQLLQGHEHDRIQSALPLRFLGAVHRLVLAGRLPRLAVYYPSTGGRPDRRRLWPAFRDALAEAAAELPSLIDRPVQTNEVRRSAALLGGFLAVSRRFGLPLRLLEIGASAGLNLRWDQYRYVAPEGSWGPRDAALVFRGCFDRPPPFDVAVRIAARRGCDPAPVDPSSQEGRLTLMSYLWPDQIERLENLARAIEVARTVPASVDQARAVDWLPERLAKLPRGEATVVFHSIVMQYLPEAEREAVTRIIRDAGARASGSAPLAWLRMEPGREQGAVTLTVWPDGAEAVVATAAFHGTHVRWLGFDGAAAG